MLTRFNHRINIAENSVLLIIFNKLNNKNSIQTIQNRQQNMVQEMVKPQEHQHYSGKTYIKNNHIIWEKKGVISIEVPLSEIKLVGEYTTSNGPLIDDWFLVLLTNKDEWKEIPMYAKGMIDLRSDLKNILNVEMQTSLYSSTIWDSKILWPEHLKGEELFELEKNKNNSYFSLFKKLVGIQQKEAVRLSSLAQRAFD